MTVLLIIYAPICILCIGLVIVCIIKEVRNGKT